MEAARQELGEKGQKGKGQQVKGQRFPLSLFIRHAAEPGTDMVTPCQRTEGPTTNDD
jgi:hypothetical protein